MRLAPPVLTSAPRLASTSRVHGCQENPVANDFAEMTAAILDEIARRRCVSLDIFDTLVMRPFADPKHVFNVMENTAATELGFPMQRFAMLRVAAERHVRGAIAGSGRQEITLREIYAVLSDELVLSPEQTEAAMAFERRIETGCCRPTPLLAELKARIGRGELDGVRFVLASDMYLEPETVETILRNCGIDFHERLFLSSVEGRTKHTGDAYDGVVAHFGVRASEVLHVGDNLFTDIGNAKKRGLTAMHYPTRTALGEVKPTGRVALYRPHSRLANAFALDLVRRGSWNAWDARSDTLKSDEAYEEAFGRTVLAPLLTSLCFWLERKIDQHDVDKLFFLARDGQIVHKAFEMLFGDGLVAHEYLPASRRMSTLPFTVLSPREMRNYFTHAFRTAPTARALLAELPRRARMAARLEELGWNLDAPIGRRREELARLIAENSGLLTLEMADERAEVTRFYAQKIAAAQRPAMFDLGWRGSLQAAICRAVPELADRFHGFYFGTDAAAVGKLMARGIPYASYAISNGVPEHLRSRIQVSTDLIEFLFSADHPSCETVRRRERGWELSYLPTSEAERRSQERAGRIHRHALDAIGEARDRWGLDMLRLIDDPIEVQNGFTAFLGLPGRRDAEFFRDVRVFSGIGDETGVPIIDTGAGWSIRREERSKWKPGFRRSMSPVQRGLHDAQHKLFSAFAPVRWLYRAIT
jgi:FMN phosphatase YigB (HAD superfamily)